MVSDVSKSEFNDAIGFLKDLRQYFREANYYARQQDAYNWSEALFILYRELYNFCKDKKTEDIKDIKERVQALTNNQNRNGTVGIPSELYWKLHEFNLFLKQVYGSSGLETKTIEDASSALG